VRRRRTGRFGLDDPITAWAPELSTTRVLRSADGPLDQTDPAARPITAGGRPIRTTAPR
jgi:CubicO group peptidase (beta-lactamase class C family)